MPFEPGKRRPLNAGRKKGAPNKRTLVLKEILEQGAFCPLSKLIELFERAEQAYLNSPAHLKPYYLKLAVDICTDLLHQKQHLTWCK